MGERGMGVRGTDECDGEKRERGGDGRWNTRERGGDGWSGSEGLSVSGYQLRDGTDRPADWLTDRLGSAVTAGSDQGGRERGMSDLY